MSDHASAVRDRIRLAMLICCAGALAMPDVATAHPDDRKTRNLQPIVTGPIYRLPDEWKTRGVLPPAEADPESTFDSKNIILKSWVPVNNFPGFSSATWRRAQSCRGYVSPSGREYALVSLGWGMSVVEVTDPTNPTIVGVVSGPNSRWRDVDYIGEMAYVVSDQVGVGIQVVDLSQVDNGVVTHVRNFSQGGHTTTHTMIANRETGYLYLCGGNAANGGLIPASTHGDPTFPTFTGNGWRTQYVHEVELVNYTSGPYAGREIAFLFAAGPYYGPAYTKALFIADVTDKNDIITLSGIDYPAMRFLHQGTLSADLRYLYVNDELDGPDHGVHYSLKRVFDVTDLAHPRLISTFENGVGQSIDHNEYVNGRYLYQSNYTSGLRVWDLSEPLRPVEVAYIDTHPDSQNATYNGAWGNYPFLPSGSILISDIQRGLFVVQLSLLEPAIAGPAPTALSPGQQTLLSVSVGERNAETASVDVMVSVNGGPYAAHPMASTVSGEYQGVLPALGCFDRMSYYIRATSVDQREFTYPLRGADEPLTAVVRTGETIIFADDFEQDLGWTVQNTGTVSGAWERAVPLYDGGHGAVIGDYDGSGWCYVTGNTFNEGVKGGPTRLVSPVLDLSTHPEARISYARWVLSIMWDTDELVTEVSGDDGTTWMLVDSVGPATGGWQQAEFRVADYITPTSEVRVRFSISNHDDSVTEAGIDSVIVSSPVCEMCYANCDGSVTPPVLNIDDFLCFIDAFSEAQSLPVAQQIEHYANCDGSTAEPVLTIDDFLCFIDHYSQGCP